MTRTLTGPTDAGWLRSQLLLPVDARDALTNFLNTVEEDSPLATRLDRTLALDDELPDADVHWLDRGLTAKAVDHVRQLRSTSLLDMWGPRSFPSASGLLVWQGETMTLPGTPDYQPVAAVWHVSEDEVLLGIVSESVADADTREHPVAQTMADRRFEIRTTFRLAGRNFDDQWELDFEWCSDDRVAAFVRFVSFVVNGTFRMRKWSNINSVEHARKDIESAKRTGRPIRNLPILSHTLRTVD